VRISVGEIKDYQKCPLFYKLKNVDELPITKTVDEYFVDYFKLALYYYYFCVIEKKSKSFEGLMKRWEELWFSSDMLDIFSEEDLKSKSNEAVIMMSDFYKKFSTEAITPIAVNFKYESIFPGTENLHVTGDIDLIKVVNDRTRKSETHMSFFSLSSRYPDQFMLKNDIGISVASYAFRSSFKSKEDKITIISIKNSEDSPTLRTGNDFSRAENICTGIKNGVFYPAPNIISCAKCSFKMFCLNDKSINMGVASNV
jgi:hypothetical protein